MAECILIADDEPDMRVLLRDLFEEEGYRVLTAADGQQAVALALSHLPAVILLDVMMPKMDGIQACRILKSDPRTAHIPVALLTATRALVLNSGSGADADLPKPFDLEVLLSLTERLARRHSMPDDRAMLRAPT